MKEIQLPYGRKTITLQVEDAQCRGVLSAPLHDAAPERDESGMVREALRHPHGTPALEEIARGKRKVTIISSDHTRPVPSGIIMPLLLEEIRKGNPDAEITILIATGLHRATTREEMTERYGEEIVKHERIVVHDCDKDDEMVFVDKLPSGGRLVLNRLVTECDLLIAEGFIEPHFFAGFSGGRKSVLPGVASRETVMYNHHAAFIHDKHARTGVIQDNPIHKDMIFAARAVNLQFIVNVVINAKHQILRAFAGDCDEAHIRGREYLESLCVVDAVPADIVVATNGGYPMDQNIYQAVKGMTAAEACVREGGVIVMVAASEDGHGGKTFYETFRDEKDLSRMMRTFTERKPEETIPDQWQSQIFARVLQKARIIYVSEVEDNIVRDMHMTPAHTMDEAMRLAKEMSGRDEPEVVVIPDGVSVIVRG